MGNEHVECLKTSGDGKLILSIDTNCRIRMWTLERDADGSCSVSLKWQASHPYYGYVSPFFSKDAQHVFCCSTEERIEMINVHTGQISRQFYDHGKQIFRMASISHDLFASCAEENIKVWSIRTGKPICNVYTRYPRSISVNPQSTRLAVGLYGSSIEIYQVNVDSSSVLELLKEVGQNMDTESVISSCFSRDGSILASGDSYGYIRLWDARNDVYSMFRAFPADNYAVDRLTFSPSSLLLASCGHQSGFKVWNIADGSCLHENSQLKCRITSVEFVPQRKDLIIACGESAKMLLLPINYDSDEVV